MNAAVAGLSLKSGVLKAILMKNSSTAGSAASGFEKIYIACGYSDLQRSIDGFVGIIQQEFKLDPFQRGILFLFYERKNERIKGFLWEGDGFSYISVWKQGDFNGRVMRKK